MAETSRERTGEFVQKLFELLIQNPDGLKARVAIDELAKKIKLTPYEAGEYETSGGRRFDKLVRFATVDCAKAGWLQKENGIWSITDAGVTAYRKFKTPGDLYREATRLYRAWKIGQPEKPSTEPRDTSDEAIIKNKTVTFEEAEEQALSEIQDFFSSINPYDFQEMVAALLRAMGYYVSWISPPGKDGGVDIIAYPDPLGTKSPRIKVQVKRTTDKIGADGVRAFLALINEGDVGLYVAVGGFTRDADEFARNRESRRITLINLDRFRELWIENYSRLEDVARNRFPLTPIYFLTPED
jgi:restriction system protein